MKQARWCVGLAVALSMASGLALDGAQPAQADDGSRYGWNSLYVGGSLGYSWIGQDVDVRRPAPASKGSASLDGIGGTLLLGYRHPLDHARLVIGAEADFTVGDNGATFRGYKHVADFMVTLRGTLGVFVRPDLLWFATGGVGWLGVNVESANLAVVNNALAPADRRHSETLVGGVVGTGLEWDMGHAVHLRAEYLYGAFPGYRHETALTDRHIDTDVHQIRIGAVVSLQNPYDDRYSREDIDRDRYGREPLK